MDPVAVAGEGLKEGIQWGSVVGLGHVEAPHALVVLNISRIIVF